ncbi:hypothetical protein LTR64_005627 [Lithohypha guttulata]|uniref:uncharacterized protein n=1 Tax=Lithohypha guttulata TaxID=1690604 RepID=UPI002DE01C32|nr:hypothetical protein LTR51_002579 [Lithohypha guttulata]
MPIESRQRTTTIKPLTPTLSSHLRTRPNHGLTPRLAGAIPTSPASQVQPQTRSLRQQTLSPERPDDERSISFYSNITPRSGARISRIDTESPSTPDTAAKARIVADQPQEEQSILGLGLNSPVYTPSQPRPKATEQLSFLPTATGRRGSGCSNISSVRDNSKAFRANDSKPTSIAYVASSRTKPTYSPQPQSPRLSPQKELDDVKNKLDDKFFYANDIPQQHVARSATSLSDTKSTIAPALATSTRSLLGQTPSPLLSDERSITDRRRSSSLNFKPVITTMDEKSHRKSLSGSSTIGSTIKSNATPELRQALQNDLKKSLLISSGPPVPPEDASPISPFTAPSWSIASNHPDATSRPSDPVSTDAIKKPLVQPRHARGSSETIVLQPVTKEQLEAAANARRERKVLDLEISNSSLLAINKTLEKELKKQNNELRRFRRLSRSGRLSLIPTATNRVISGASMSTLSTLDEVNNDACHLSFSPTASEPGSHAGEDDFLSDDDSSFTESSDVIRRRARDEKKLMLDLQRHQQLLLESQKLTQSIQRCLNFTDELIKDGTKALAYQVEEKDVQLGGRVLSQDNDEALSEVDFDGYQQSMIMPGQGLLSPAVTKDAIEEASMWANELQTIDGNNSADHVVLDKSITQSPSSTVDLSPVSLPES